MKQEEFETLMSRMDETYASQPKVNDTQKSVFFAALKDLNYKDVVVAFIEHTKVDQWKPSVPKQLLMHMPKNESLSKRFIMNFFDRKPITDLDAVKNDPKMLNWIKQCKNRNQESIQTELPLERGL